MLYLNLSYMRKKISYLTDLHELHVIATLKIHILA